MANDPVLNPGETLGDAVQVSPQQPVPQQAASQLNEGETLGLPVPGIERHDPTLFERAKQFFTEDIPQFSHRTVYDPAYGREQLLAPEAVMTPSEQSKHPIVQGVAELAGGMTSPENISIMAGTAGLGTLAGPEANLAAKVFPRLLSAGFSAQQIIGAAKESGEVWDAIKRGDESEALRLTTHVVGELGMAALAGQHAAGIEATPSTIPGKRIQGVVDQASFRTRQAFRSDTAALAKASAMHESASVLYDQRLNEHDNAVDSAIRASKVADQAKIDLANGKITQQQYDDINTAASKAASNTRKATQALDEAYQARSVAAAEEDRLTRKASKSNGQLTQKQSQDIGGAKEDFMRAVPSARRGAAAYTDQDYEVGRRYLENHHENVQKIETTQDLYDSLDQIERNMNSQVRPAMEQYAREPINTNPRMDVRDRLAESLGGKTRADFIPEAMKALEGYNLIDPTIEEADTIRQQLNSEVRDNLKRNFRDIQTALDVDPEFAGKYYALESLREGIYGALEERGVRGAREIRQDQRSIIKLRNAAEDQIKRGDVKVRGSGESGPIRKAIAAGVRRGSTIAGAAAGSILGPFGAGAGAELGAVGGEYFGKKIAPGDLSRNDLIQRSFKIKGGGVPSNQVEGGNAAPQNLQPPGVVSPVMQLYTPQRELTPLHSDLATHYGEDMNQSGYLELEQRFKDDIADKRLHNVPLEGDEKTLLGKINAADGADRLAAQKQAQEMTAKGQEQIPTVNLPEKFDPLLQIPESRLHEALNTHKAIQHDLAHAIVADARGLTPIDGIRSHLHPTNISSGDLMSAPIDKSEFLDKDGEVDWNKIKGRIADIAATYMAGGVANDLYHGVPMHENPHLGSDISELRSILKNVGFSPAEIEKHISLAAEDAASVLGQPGVQDVIERHAAVREQGLNQKYHVSPERMEQILDDAHEVIHETGRGRKPSKSAGAGKPAAKENGAGAEAENKAGVPTAVRQAGKGLTSGENESAQGSGGTGTAEPRITNEIAPKLSAAEEPEDKLLTNERQLPLKRPHLVEVVDKSGTRHVEQVMGYSNEDALKAAKNKYPDWSELHVGQQPGFVNLEEPEKYSIPTGKHLSMPESGNRAPVDTFRHELGHALVGLNEGMEPNGMLRHTHPDLKGGNARASVSWDIRNMVEPGTRRIQMTKMPGLIRNFMGGIAADEAFNGVPRAANHNFTSLNSGGDGSQAYRMLREAGYGHDESMQIMHRAIDQAKQYLTQPGVSDIIKENENTREPGLSRQYHYSPDRLKQMHAEAQRRIQSGQPNNRAVAGENVTGREGDVSGGQAEAAPGDRQTIQAAELIPQIDAHEKEGGSTFTPEGENLAGKNLYSVGSYPERTAQLDKLTPEALAKFKTDNRDLLGQPNHVVGTWKDPDTGKAVLDVSKTFKDRDEAIAAGKQANQKAIYHLGSNTEIPTGGTGEFIPKLGPTSQKLLAQHGTTQDPLETGFILPSGSKIGIGSEEHENAIARAENRKPEVGQKRADNLVNFINNENAIRVRSGIGGAGQQVSFSVPDKVTPEQMDAMKRAAAATERGRVFMEKAGETAKYTGQGQRPYADRDFVTGNDIEPMLHQIGAHPNPAEFNPKLGPKGSSVPLMSKPLKIEGTGEDSGVNTLDVAQALNEFTKKKIGALEPGKQPEKQVARAKSLAEDEAKYQLAQANSGKDWYTDDMGKHDQVLSAMRPELNDKNMVRTTAGGKQIEVPAKLGLFKANEAIMSSGQKPYGNFKAGVKGWDHYNETGEFPPVNPDTGRSWGPRAANSYGYAVQTLNGLIKEKGESGAVQWLLEDHPLKELRPYMQSETQVLRGKNTDMVPGAMVLGPKRGPFFLNLNGIEAPFTADMWVSRTWNRWMGTIEHDPETGEITSDSPRTDAERKLMKQSFSETADKLGLSTSSLQAVLWFYEQKLYGAHGVPKESWTFSDAARRAQKEEQEAQGRQDEEMRQGNVFTGRQTPGAEPVEPGKGISALDFVKLLGGNK